MRKQCIWCKEIKPISQFRKTKKTLDGHDCCCKKCISNMRSNPYRARTRKNKLYTMDKTVLGKGLCRILIHHKNTLEEDNERLPTSFIVDVIRHNI